MVNFTNHARERLAERLGRTPTGAEVGHSVEAIDDPEGKKSIVIRQRYVESFKHGKPVGGFALRREIAFQIGEVWLVAIILDDEIVTVVDLKMVGKLDRRQHSREARKGPMKRATIAKRKRQRHSGRKRNEKRDIIEQQPWEDE